MINYITKDLTTVTEGIVVHGCNCQGRMGSGVALAIRNKWPTAFEEYKDFLLEQQHQSLSPLGKANIVSIEKYKLYVANCLTQEYYGNDGGQYALPAAILTSLDHVFWFAATTPTLLELESGVVGRLPIYMPRIGCGLGGLSWEADVEPIISSLNGKYNLNIYVCDL